MDFKDLSPLLTWYEQHHRDLPWRHTKDPYLIWVSEIMLQQTRVEAVLPYYTRFITALPTVEALANAPEKELLKLWEGLGYYSRVRNMRKAAEVIMTEHGGRFPQNFEQIRALSGIGDYTAGAIASFAFDLPYPAVDGNVLRVAARLLAYDQNILSPAAKKELTAAVAAAQPRERAADFNQALIELGALICLPNGTPRCEICPLREVCAAQEKGLVDALPVRIKHTARRKEQWTVLVLREGDRVALRRRPDTGLLAGLFEPFCLQGHLTAEEIQKTLTVMGLSPLRVAPLGAAKHIFSHIEWYMEGFEVILPEGSAKDLPEGLFLAPREEIDRRFALPSAYRAYRPFM